MDAQAEAPASHPRHYSSRVWLQPVYQTVSPLFEAGIYPPYFVCSVQLLRRCRTISQTELRVNEEIRGREVRVVTSEGEQLGIMPVRDALRLAQERDLDLVEVAPTAKPPVCRIMDYGKFRYEQSKKEREARKNQKTTDVKEVRMTPKIEDHDFQVKLRAASKFLKDGDKVKAQVRFRGREIVHADLGRKLLNRLAAELQDVAAVERDSRLEGRSMVMILTPKQEKAVGKSEQSEKPEQPQKVAKVAEAVQAENQQKTE
jgi:translation initiation factor IF-3